MPMSVRGWGNVPVLRTRIDILSLSELDQSELNRTEHDRGTRESTGFLRSRLPLQPMDFRSATGRILSPYLPHRQICRKSCIVRGVRDLIV
jgi:hypothetical protein